MLRAIRNKALALLGIMAMAGVIGCHHSDDPCPPEEPQHKPNPDKVNLCLKIKYDGQNETRAVAPDGFEGPDISTDFEKVSELRVIIIRGVPKINENGDTIKQANGKPKIDRLEVEANKLVGTNEYGYPKAGSLDFEVNDHEEKFIFLIANESSLKSPIADKSALAYLRDNYIVGTTIDNFDGLTNWTVSMPEIGADGIVMKNFFSDSNAKTPMLPMSESFKIFVNVKTKGIKEDTYYSDLFLTRAAAKASFYLGSVDPAYKDVKITSVSLWGVGSTEYVFPNKTAYSPEKYVEDPDSKEMIPNKDVEEMYITSFDTPSDDNQALTYVVGNKEIAMWPGGDPDKYDHQILGPIYFPESKLNAGEHYMVSVTLSTGVTLSAPLKTNILNFGGCDAIARNTHLKINMGFTALGLTAEATVFPYTAVDLNPEFGFATPVTDKIVLPPSFSLPAGGTAVLTASVESKDIDKMLPLIAVSTDTGLLTFLEPYPEDSSKEVSTGSTAVKEVSDKSSLGENVFSGKFQLKLKGVAPGKTTLMVYSQTGVTASCTVNVQ